MTQQILRTYPASKRSRLETFNEIHESTNWYDIEYNGWTLPGNKESHDWCGSWQTKGCMNLKGHENTDYPGKIFIKRYQKSCYRASCEKCFKKWLARESNKATSRIATYAKKSGKPPKHVVVSVPYWHYDTEFKELRKCVYRVLKKVNAVGGTVIFHPFRFNKQERIWYYSPHFHIIGFGWIKDTEEIYNSEGWIVKNLGVRDSVFATFYYQLSHCGIKEHIHSLSWFGDLSYSKLKVEKEPETNVCPLCNEKLVHVYYQGLFEPPPPDCEFEMFVNPEGWHRVEPKQRLLDPLTKHELREKRLTCEMYWANKGVCLN